MIVGAVYKVQAQTEVPNSKSTVEFGLGTSNLRTWNMYMLEVGVSHKYDIGNNFVNNLHLNFGHLNRDFSSRYGPSNSSNAVKYIMSRFHFDHNILYKIFSKPNSRFKVNVGTGYSILWASEIRINKSDGIIDDVYDIEVASLGINFVLEPTYTFHEKNVFSIGIISQNYINQDDSNGIMIKYGRLLR